MLTARLLEVALRVDDEEAAKRNSLVLNEDPVVRRDGLRLVGQDCGCGMIHIRAA